jgi:hypothetical protein
MKHLQAALDARWSRIRIGRRMDLYENLYGTLKTSNGTDIDPGTGILGIPTVNLTATQPSGRLSGPAVGVLSSVGVQLTDSFVLRLISKGLIANSIVNQAVNGATRVVKSTVRGRVASKRDRAFIRTGAENPGHRGPRQLAEPHINIKERVRPTMAGR